MSSQRVKKSNTRRAPGILVATLLASYIGGFRRA